MAMVKSSNNHKGDTKKHKKIHLGRRKTVTLDIFGKPFPRSFCLFSLQPPCADHMTRRAKCIRNALVAMRVVIQLWGRALTFSTSLNFYTFNVRETAVTDGQTDSNSRCACARGLINTYITESHFSWKSPEN